MSVEHVISTTLKISPERVTDDLAFSLVPEWDSMNHVNLMLALEAAYAIEIDEERMVELTSVKAIRRFVETLAERPQ